LKYKRVFLIVLDSVGIGEQPDSYKYGDEGSNTIRSISKSKEFDINTMRKMGIFNIDDIGFEKPTQNPTAAYCKLQEVSSGKDTTTGHWEMAGIINEKPFPTYPNGSAFMRRPRYISPTAPATSMNFLKEQEEECYAIFHIQEQKLLKNMVKNI